MSVRGKGGVVTDRISGRLSLRLENYGAIFYLDAEPHINGWPKIELEKKPRYSEIHKLLIPEAFL